MILSVFDEKKVGQVSECPTLVPVFDPRNGGHHFENSFLWWMQSELLGVCKSYRCKNMKLY